MIEKDPGIQCMEDGCRNLALAECSRCYGSFCHNHLSKVALLTLCPEHAKEGVTVDEQLEAFEAILGVGAEITQADLFKLLKSIWAEIPRAQGFESWYGPRKH